MYTVLRIIHTMKHNLPEKREIMSLNLWCYSTTFTHFYSPYDYIEMNRLTRNVICNYFAKSTEISVH